MSPSIARRIGAGDRGNDAQRRKRPAEQQRDLGVQPDQRRVVDVAPAEVPAAVEEVELVAEVAVAGEDREVDGELEGGEKGQEAPVERGMSCIVAHDCQDSNLEWPCG